MNDDPSAASLSIIGDAVTATRGSDYSPVGGFAFDVWARLTAAAPDNVLGCSSCAGASLVDIIVLVGRGG